MSGSEPTRLVGTRWDEDGNDVAQSVLTGENMKVRALCLTTPEVVVPLLFVPGIMGTRLKVSGRDKGAAWFPPGLCAIAGDGSTHSGRGAWRDAGHWRPRHLQAHAGRV